MNLRSQLRATLIVALLALSACSQPARALRVGANSFPGYETLFLARDPMRGVPIRRGGVYDLAPVRVGIGVTPRGAAA